VPRRSLQQFHRHARTGVVASVVAVAACGSDRGVPENIAGGYNGGGVGGITGSTCYQGPAPAAGGSAAVITVDPATRYQTMQGFGASVRLFDDPATTNTTDPVTKRGTAVPPVITQGAIFETLYADLALTRVRFLPSDGGGIEPANDNADPLVADPSKFDYAWKNGDGQIAYMPDLVRRGVTTWFAAPLSLEKWMTPSNPAEYAEWAMAMLHHWKDRGYEMPYFSLESEPGSAAGGALTGAYLRDVAKLLGARIKADGMKTKLVVPDDVSPQEALARLQVILADADARQYVGAIAYHLYARGGEAQIKQLGDQYGIPIWMTDFSLPDDDFFTWAMALHELIADDGVSAIDYKWAFLGDYGHSQLVRLETNAGSYVRFTPTTQYYVLGQYSRYLRPGAVRVAASSNDPNVKATAYVDGTKLIVIATYLGDGKTIQFERQTRIELGSGGPCVKRADVSRASATDNGVLLGSVSVDIPRITYALQVRSVTTFVGQP
jgi:O-glycosyl hydrolase